MVRSSSANANNSRNNTDLGRKDVIAELTDDTIRTLSRNALETIVTTAHIPFIQEERLELQDRETLERLAFLARNCCKNAVI